MTKLALSLKKFASLNQPLTSLKGIGPKRADLFAAKGIRTILDLLYFFPIRYEDRTRLLRIEEAEINDTGQVWGKVVSGKEEMFYPSRKRIFRIMIADGAARLELVWFHYHKAHMGRYTKRHMEIVAYGKIQDNRGRKQIIHPDIAILARGQDKKPLLGYYPVYSAIEGCSQKTIRGYVRESIDRLADLSTDWLPEETIRRLNLKQLPNAIREIHNPGPDTPFGLLDPFRTEAHRRIIFDRFFSMMLQMAFLGKKRKQKPGPVFSIPHDLKDSLENSLSFTLTTSQLEVIHDIIRDVKSGSTMNRLIQGDVGCGKTAVAVVASFLCVCNRRQAAMMAPTQILAEQHYEFFTDLSEKMGFRPVILTSALDKAERNRICGEIAKGRYNVIIGTHSLIQKDVSFSDLGLVIIDEQHRFGVRQRALLESKGKNPHLLVMTATPIPRTLALTVYSELDISVVRELPAGRKPVITRLMDEEGKREVDTILKEKMSQGQQVIVVCPVIEGRDDLELKNALELYEKLKKRYGPDYRVGMIHGRLPPEGKRQVMEQFKNGSIQLLVGTTVIEVGVHAPGATVMVVEHPERFGLAQLHQLRGRIGRGSEQGVFILMIPKGLSEEAIARIRILAQTGDGFEIARKDLEMRGHGEFVGVRQAGVGELDFAEMIREQELLLKAKKEVERILSSDPKLSKPAHLTLKEILNMNRTATLDY